jgi:hypothetical protein
VGVVPGLRATTAAAIVLGGEVAVANLSVGGIAYVGVACAVSFVGAGRARGAVMAVIGLAYTQFDRMHTLWRRGPRRRYAHSSRGGPVERLADHMPRAWSSEIQLMTTVLSASDPALPLPS